jgi:hypothetical protein
MLADLANLYTDRVGVTVTACHETAGALPSVDKVVVEVV